MLSFWEQQSFIHYQYIIVGGGIVGLSTAISIKEKEPKAKVLLLERGIFPTGASTKNAGFACFGSLTELCSDLNAMSRESALQLVKLRWEGLQLLRKRLSDSDLGYEANGGYELIRRPEMKFLDRIDEINAWLMPIFEQNVFTERPELRNMYGFNPSEVLAVVGNPFEGQIHTGHMMKNLYLKATAIGVEVFTGTEVTGMEEEGGKVKVWTKNPVKGGGEFYFSCQKAVVCTNAFTRSIFPELEIRPGRGLVLVTKPIENLPWKGVFHYDEGYFYFRNIGNRILFGGGRNLDFDGETTSEMGINPKIFDRLKKDLHEIIIPGRKFEIETMWSGIMAFGPDKQPIIKKHTPNILMGVRMGGMGVAIGTKVGQQLADMISA